MAPQRPNIYPSVGISFKDKGVQRHCKAATPPAVDGKTVTSGGGGEFPKKSLVFVATTD